MKGKEEECFRRQHKGRHNCSEQCSASAGLRPVLLTERQLLSMNTPQHFEEVEILHNCRTYYASGYVTYSITECIGGSYEGYAYETVYERELTDITINDLWYMDEETGDGVDILCSHNYKEIERIAEEHIRYKFE